MILVPGMVEDHHDNSENCVSTKKISRNSNGRKWQLLPNVVTPLQESMDNSSSLFNYRLNNPYNDLINDFDPYLEYSKGYQNRTAFEDGFYG